MTTIYPKQPGYNIYHDPSKIDYKKISSTALEKINNGEFKHKKDYSLPRQNETQELNYRNGSSLSYSQCTYVNHFDNKPILEHFQPNWVKLDKQVLRFSGYFKESVSESKIEFARVRKLTLFYYLVDDTLEITEMKESNSGLPQGIFLKRGRIQKEQGSLTNKECYHFRDLKVGNDILIYGKFIKVFEYDQYTKEFYNKMGIEQLDKQEIPLDSYHNQNSNKFVPKKDNLMKDFLEHRLGGGKVKNQKQFLENDRRVLKFNAKHDSLKYVINYYLADDTVEIKEIYFTNSGRDRFPLFLKRNKLPKKFSVTQPGDIIESDYVSPTDIEPFMTLWAFNRPFRILGCDKFTHDYYLDQYQKKFPIGGFEDAPTKDKSSYEYPPYNGFGDEQDSLGNCNRLILKVPKKDYFKYIDNDKIILRFLAKLNTVIPEDKDRRFLISFFMSDDSIQVYEMSNRNSGIWEGKFLERGKYKNIENENKKFTISDFQINKSIRINTFSLCILDGDDFTKKWIADNLV